MHICIVNLCAQELLYLEMTGFTNIFSVFRFLLNYFNYDVHYFNVRYTRGEISTRTETKTTLH